MKNYIIIFSSIILLSSCGESTEEARERGYEEGYYEGVAEVCYEVKRISDTFHERLRGDSVCY